ncbi:MAG: ComF family protein [Proteobacteria bacterium]|nr:ComF family protein [Pseudomonadota bacterium]
MTIEIEGNWKTGLAFDVHTLSSTYLGPNEFGHDQWENTRSEMGELVYKLKYLKDRSALASIVALLDKIKGIDQFDYIIPIPPTDQGRVFQPVIEIALAIGKHHGVEVLTDFLKKKSGEQQLKNVDDPDERKKLLRASLHINSGRSVAGRDILLVDDLYRSGATLSVATDLLYEKGKANKVCVLTMTKTRRNR